MPERLLPDHARPQHKTVGNDFRFLRIFLQDGHEKAGQAHDGFQNLMNVALSTDSGEMTLSSGTPVSPKTGKGDHCFLGSALKFPSPTSRQEPFRALRS